MKWIGLAVMGLLTASMYGQEHGRSRCGGQVGMRPGRPQSFPLRRNRPSDVRASDEGEAQLYILEVQDHVAICPFGCGETVKLGLDGRWAGATKGNSFLVLPVESGEHHLCVEWDAHAWRLHKHVQLAGFSAEKGKSYYFRVHITPGTTETIDLFRFGL